MVKPFTITKEHVTEEKELAGDQRKVVDGEM